MAMTLAVGWIAAMTLLSFSGLWVMVWLGVRPNDVDLPVLRESEIERTVFESLGVTLGCAAVIAVSIFLRRRQRGAREPAGSRRQRSGATRRP